MQCSSERHNRQSEQDDKKIITFPVGLIVAEIHGMKKEGGLSTTNCRKLSHTKETVASPIIANTDMPQFIDTGKSSI
jgi:hypothetical protein